MATASQKEVSDAIQAALVHAQVLMVVIAVKVTLSVLVLTIKELGLANAPKVDSSALTVTDRVVSTSVQVLIVTQVAKVLPVLVSMLVAKVVSVLLSTVEKVAITEVLHPASARVITTPTQSIAQRSALSIRKNTLTPMLLSV